MLTEKTISHSSKLLVIVILSVYKAKYMAICKAKKEAILLKY